MDAKFVRVLDSRVKEVVKEVKKINGKKTEEVVTFFGFSIKIIYNGQTCKPTTGPFMTEEQNEIIKGQADYPTDREEVNKLIQLQKECDTAESRVKLITEVLMKAQKDNFEVGNVGAVAKYATGYNTPDRKKLKLALCQPDHPFNVKAAIAAVFPELQSELGIEPPANQNPTTGQEHTTGEASVEEAEVIEEPSSQQGGGELIRGTATPQAPASGNTLQTSRQNMNINDLFKFVHTHPELAQFTALIALLVPLLRRKKGGGGMELPAGNFDPGSNFLEYLTSSIERSKVSLHTQDQYEFVKDIFIRYFTKVNRISIVDGQPYLAFWDFDEHDLKKLRKWMLKEGRKPSSDKKRNTKSIVKKEEAKSVEKKEGTPSIEKEGYTKNSCNFYLGLAKSACKKAQMEGIITEHFNPFYKYKIPQGTRRNISVNPKSIKKLFNCNPKKVPNWAGWCEEKALDFWIMSYFAFGINQMDFLSLEKTQVQKGFFKFKRAKIEKREDGEGLEITVYIIPALRKLMDKWKDTTDSKYFFPFFNFTEKDNARLANFRNEVKFVVTPDNEEAAYKQVYNDILTKKANKFTGMMNAYMRKIAKRLGLKEDLITYAARQSFANHAIRKGLDPYRVMRFLGQKDFRSFLSYANEVLTDEEEVKLFEEINAFYTENKMVETIKTPEGTEFYEDDDEAEDELETELEVEKAAA